MIPRWTRGATRPGLYVVNRGSAYTTETLEGGDDPVCKARRNLAELGIGTNPNARRPDNVLEAEKIKGTVHVAIGDNAHMGGRVEADFHEDFVLPQPDLYLDGILVIEGGEWKI